MPFESDPPAAGQEPEAFVEMGRDLGGTHRDDADGSEPIASGIPSRRRQIVLTVAVFVVVQHEPGTRRCCRAIHEETHGVAAAHRRERVRVGRGHRPQGDCPFAVDVERLDLLQHCARAGWPGAPRSTRCAVGSSRCSQLSSTQSSSLCRKNSTMLSSRVMPVRGGAEGRRDGCEHRVAIRRCGELATPCAVGEVDDHLARDLHRDPCLPTPPTPVIVTHGAPRRRSRLVAARRRDDERRQLGREVRRPARPLIATVGTRPVGRVRRLGRRAPGA